MIAGSLVTLRPARPQDRRKVYDWLARSDLTRSMMGPPDYPDVEVPTWDEFCADYQQYFFDGSNSEMGRSFIVEVLGETIGHISYSQVNGTRRAVELDIWLRSEGDCGKGYGSDALATLTHWLIANLHHTEFVIRPSRRNQRAVMAYAKAGFQVAKITTQEETATYGPPDYGDALVMRLEKPA